RRWAELGAPSRVYPHHGNLSKDSREHAERQLKGRVPATVVATTTMEAGIDVGSMKSVAQVGLPPSVAALSQRLGRSGRRAGEPAILRVSIIEEDNPRDAIQDRLRAQTVQS